MSCGADFTRVHNPLGLFEIDDSGDFMPIEGIPGQFEKDSNGDLNPATHAIINDPEFELDSNLDIMPKE